jgi:O-methyltransferase
LKNSHPWLQTPFIQSFGGGLLERILIRIASWIEMRALGGHKDKETLRQIRKTRRERKWLLTANEAFMVHSIARAQSQQPGAIAEIGVFEGGSARMICEAKGDVALHLFDTFEGLPEASEHDATAHNNKANLYACSLESVKKYLQPYPNVSFYKGFFPDSAAQLPEDETFSFAHFDVDLYESTLACLEYFYPKMITGGIILSHDYSILTGVRKAFTEFLDDKPESLIELSTTQCFVVKI